MTLVKALNLQRPLAIWDLEATGPTDRDRIVQFAIEVHSPDGPAVDSWSTLVDPEVPIPAEVSEVHGIRDADVFGIAPIWALVAPRAIQMLQGCDFAGHGLKFDLGLFKAECKRVGINWDWETSGTRVIDTLRIFQIMRPRDLSAAHIEYVGRPLEDAHKADVDVVATRNVLLGQLYRHHQELPAEVGALAELLEDWRDSWVDRTGKIVWRNGIACIGFGKKWVSIPLTTVYKKDRGYFQWMLDNDFPADVKAICREALEGRFPVKETK